MTRCNVCNGTNVQRAMWVRVNTNEMDGDFFDRCPPEGTADTWCEDCKAHTELVDEPDQLPNQFGQWVNRSECKRDAQGFLRDGEGWLVDENFEDQDVTDENFETMTA
jgi:hypothetical protein